MLHIDDIVADGKSLVTGEAPRAKEAPVVETTAAPTTTVEPGVEQSSATDTTTEE